MKVEDLAARVHRDPTLAARLKEDPAGELSRIAKEPVYKSDRWIYRIVASVLGLIGLIAVVGAILLAFAGSEIPDVLVALGSAAVGALAGLFNPLQSSSEG